jgi:V/A-type H+-transporting ATPase subunit E
MTGLDKILKAIEADARAGADAVIAQAEQEAQELLASAKKEAEAKCKKIAETSVAEVQAVLDRGESAAALQEKKLLLEAKQQIISNIVACARKRLKEYTNPEYTNVILSMIGKYAHNKQGKILFSAADRMRLTDDFEDKLIQALNGKSGASLSISREEPSFEGGFLLVYGDVEENCSFDALFADGKDSLLDRVNSLVFD